MATLKFQDDYTPNPLKRWLTIAGVLIVGLIALSMAVGSIVNVPPGEVGIMFDSMNGGVQDVVLGEGWHIQLPFTQKIYTMSIRSEKVEYPASAASQDLQAVSTHIAVSYHISPSMAPKIFKEIGADYADKFIAPAIQEKVKASTAQFKAEELIQNREIVKDGIADSLRITLGKYNLNVDEVSIMNFDFSPEFNQAINAKVVAQQNELTAKNILLVKQVEANQRVAEATGVANSVVISAQAEANATLTKAIANAESLRLQREQATPELIELQKVKQWDGRLPVWVSGASTPMIQIGSAPLPANVSG